ncbi:galactinol synthase 1-like [Dioscorea cayenensis subsp. rotundata]|uniref:Hexosyltransferase n=1 Tax=Dioscorea cayennensis subsp. rotundata TaxID=55577 RepID=A0AB40B2N3_DIOCR|nr:galactinol synthase 1-like [Dioscorea cayenensis subsp. rotundata]
MGFDFFNRRSVAIDSSGSPSSLTAKSGGKGSTLERKTSARIDIPMGDMLCFGEPKKSDGRKEDEEGGTTNYFLNMFFKKSYKPIPVVYNLVLAMLWCHPENVELEKVKVVHYRAAESKPWRYTRQETNMDREDIKKLVAKWWEIYNDESLDFIKAEDKVEIEVEEEGFSKPLIMAAMQEPTIAYIPTPSAT